MDGVLAPFQLSRSAGIHVCLLHKPHVVRWNAPGMRSIKHCALEARALRKTMMNRKMVLQSNGAGKLRIPSVQIGIGSTCLALAPKLHS